MKIKQILMTFALLALTFLVNAQYKYEYMIIEFNYLLKNEIRISVDGKQYLEEKADFSPAEKATHNINPLLKKISEYETKDWELMNFETVAVSTQGTPVFFAYLRKKKSSNK